ncbi:hypothetical protein C6Y14_43470 [Streptomyces dioscori]|uniref:ATP-dependent DNA ligase family profile domain-containing protein n=1 Tax=Streptomyces dioscori TaxID=2109333 RepID=A0A2P8PTA7_9ACTN|nr:hypothetical protein [Streptomyces dioscori]PSM37230.1 hypothetical protein C6Y14_43470 [Streptomyces dioscori]
MKWDGFRAAPSVEGSWIVLHSRRSTQVGPAFPEVVAGAARLQDATALDGELIAWSADGRDASEQLQDRLHRRDLSAVQAAAQQSAHVVTESCTGS